MEATRVEKAYLVVRKSRSRFSDRLFQGFKASQNIGRLDGLWRQFSLIFLLGDRRIDFWGWTSWLFLLLPAGNILNSILEKKRGAKSSQLSNMKEENTENLNLFISGGLWIRGSW